MILHLTCPHRLQTQRFLPYTYIFHFSMNKILDSSVDIKPKSMS
ncbi:hypothetical protein HMPREF9134_00409 [Porphyromonas catoniae F0037]|uniref:Uncharacterized protein n=1 Tax=Porphyromonas catoniae F0037 TaxID=1127696 RepID=L1NGN5_9PORP|nr:hypothetical protein HMPREF9134_00409 [Porphyromonas catoniae F0037]